MPQFELILTIEPPPALRISGIAARDPRKTPLALTEKVLSQAATSVFSVVPER